MTELISEQLGVAKQLVHINAGSELIRRPLFDRFGQQVNLLTPTHLGQDSQGSTQERNLRKH